MEIKISKDLGKNYVQVSSKYGNFTGKWIGESIPLNEKICVEIDFDKIINYKITDKEYYIGNIHGMNIICGKIVNEYENFVQHFEFDDSIMMIQIKEELLKNKFIEIEIDEIQLFPVYY
jgi:hypothetical protein